MVPAGYIALNPYTQTIVHDTVTNFLSDQPAWAGGASETASGGVWATSVVSFPTTVLTAGDTLQLQFRFGTDFCGGSIGWYIDEVRVYQCATDHCPGNTCPTNSVCVETLDSYACSCTHGYTGANCDVPPTLYQWKVNTTSGCSVACGGGIQVTTSYCARVGDGVVVDDLYCLEQSDPIVTQPLAQSACNTDLCPYLSWVYTPWVKSQTCGFGYGTENRTAICQLITNGTGEILTDDVCATVMMQEPLTQLVELDECRGVYEYHIDYVSDCSPACGPTSVRTRTIVCRRSSDLVTVDSSLCSALNLIPPMPTMPCRYVPDCITLV